MTANDEPTQRQLRWYYPPYKPSREEARKDIEDYFRRCGIIRDEPSSDDGE
jgi:hypothetical protein